MHQVRYSCSVTFFENTGTVNREYSISHLFIARDAKSYN